jgi:ferredoxin
MGLRRRDDRRDGPTRLRLDPIVCDGVGMCAHLAPSLISLDPWGFPLLPDSPLAPREQHEARRAVAGCPRRALFLEKLSANSPVA